MLSDKTIFNAEKVIINGSFSTERAFTHTESVISASQNFERSFINHLNTLFSHFAKCRAKSG